MTIPDATEDDYDLDPIEVYDGRVAPGARPWIRRAVAAEKRAEALDAALDRLHDKLTDLLKVLQDS